MLTTALIVVIDAHAQHSFQRHSRSSLSCLQPILPAVFRAPPVCLQTDIFSFGSYWYEGGPRVCTHAVRYVMLAESPSFCANREPRCTKRADLSSLLPPSFDLEPMLH